MIASIEERPIPTLPNGRWFAIICLIIIAAVMILCNSCTSTKDLTKKKEETKTETEVRTVTTRTITETAQDSVKVGSDSLSTVIDFDNLKDDPITLENDNLRVDINRDPITNKINFKVKKKEKIIPVNINRNIVEEIKSDSKSKSVTKEKTKDVHKETEAGINWNYLWWLLLLLLIPLWKYRR